MQVDYPTQPKDRFEVYRFFNGLAVEGKEGLDRRRSRVPLVKSFLLEHVSSASGRTPRPPQTILQSLGVDAATLDETFMEVATWMPVRLLPVRAGVRLAMSSSSASGFSLTTRPTSRRAPPSA